MDSGPAQSVAPPSIAPGVMIEEYPGSQRGQHHVTASGGILPNMGQHQLRVQTNEGRDAKVLYHIAEVSRPLTAESHTCDDGKWVVYTPHGGFIWSLHHGERPTSRDGEASTSLTLKEVVSPRVSPGRDIEQQDTRGG